MLGKVSIIEPYTPNKRHYNMQHTLIYMIQLRFSIDDECYINGVCFEKRGFTHMKIFFQQTS